MKIAMIVAAAANNVIGKDNKLIWHLPEDLKFFKKATLNHYMIMGRKTFEALGKPLKDRVSIVITKSKKFEWPELIVVGSLKEAINLPKLKDEDRVFVIGGGEIYRQSMEIADEIYLTRVHANFEGDTTFPEIDQRIWKEVSRVDHPEDEKHAYSFSFLKYERIK